MRYLLIIALLVAGCGEIVIGPPQREPETGPHNPSTVREVLAFTAPSCSGCQQGKEQLAELRRQGVKITEVDINRRPDLARAYHIESVPTYVVLENGVEVRRTQGILTLVSWLGWLLVKVIF